jgi:hypothetical protein
VLCCRVKVSTGGSDFSGEERKVLVVVVANFVTVWCIKLVRGCINGNQDDREEVFTSKLKMLSLLIACGIKRRSMQCGRE